MCKEYTFYLTIARDDENKRSHKFRFEHKVPCEELSGLDLGKDEDLCLALEVLTKYGNSTVMVEYHYWHDFKEMWRDIPLEEWSISELMQQLKEAA